ncbi:MAG: hypothetical protein C0478_17975 [Planctomyces sp.]|nr:hypothetical protein [Planctomyces sp.]
MALVTKEDDEGRKWRVATLWKSKSFRRACTLLACWYFVLRPILIIAFEIPGPWGPPLNVSLQEGWEIELKCRRLGRETDEFLSVVSPSGMLQEHIVNSFHALGVNYAIVRRSPAPECRIWIESEGEVVSSLDLRSGDFWNSISQ